MAQVDDGNMPNAAAPEDRELSRLIQHGRDREAAELAHRLNPTEGAPMDPRQQLDAILPQLNDLVAGLDDEQLDAQTPCTSFKVRNVLEHMIGGGTMFAAAFRGETPGAAPDGDLRKAFKVAMENLQAAVSSDGALERTIAAPFGEVPGEVFARFVAVDGLVHGWDISKAIGKPYDPPADVVAAADGFARQAIGDDMRDGDAFAAAVEPPADATPIVRLAAFTGRQVA